MKIVSFKICPFVQRVTALLGVKGVDYDVEYIDLGNKPQWFLDISPNGQVPVLITDDRQVLFESDAIVEYLDEVVGSLVSSQDPLRKAQDRAWSSLASRNYLVQCSAQRSPDAQTLEERAARLSTAFGKIETRLGEDRYAGGDAVGMVDVAWLPLLHLASLIERQAGYDFLGDFPKVKRWQRNLLATGIAERSVSEDFETRFNAFYLAESTYLGQLAKEKHGAPCTGSPECTAEDMARCA